MGGFLTCKNVTEEQLEHIELFFERTLNENYYLNRYWQNVNMFILYNFASSDLTIGEIDLIESILNTNMDFSDDDGGDDSDDEY